MHFDWQGKRVKAGDVVEVYLYYNPDFYHPERGHYIWQRLFYARCLGAFMSVRTPNEDIMIDIDNFFKYYSLENNSAIALSGTDSCLETSFFLEYFS